MASNWLDFSRYAVLGLGASGKAAANLLARHGKDVTASDIRTEEDLGEDLEPLHDDVTVEAGQNVLADAQVVVTSPGLKPGLEIFERARQREIPVVSEVDLAFDASDSPWLAITGTDGKTTTTGLVGQMLEAAGRDHVVAGNIGTALCDVVEELDEDQVVVAEISANQLWSCHHLSVHTAAITNIAEDHVDYFEDFQDYPAAKRRLVELQKPDADTVLPIFDDQLRTDLGDQCPEAVTWFGRGPIVAGTDERVVYFDEQGVGRWIDGDREGVWLENFEEAAMIGPHNQLNAACAAAVARTVGVSWEDAGQGVVEFEPASHRMERVAEIDGVTYIDDSKATNTHASLAGLQGLEPPLIVIAGGRDKGLDLDEWSRVLADRAELVVVIGEITDRLVGLLVERGGDVEIAETLGDAVDIASQKSRPGSTVVLSPACSSYDMFSNYKQRGRVFQRAVEALGAK